MRRIPLWLPFGRHTSSWAADGARPVNRSPRPFSVTDRR